MNEVIVGRGGGGGKGGGGGSARAAVEAPDSLRSRQHVRVLHAISEGEIEGIVGGSQGIFFDDVPQQNADASYNFSNVSIDMDSDEFELRIDDRDGQVQLPRRGSSIEIYLGYAETSLARQGRYAVDTVEVSGPPDTIVIEGKASDLRGSGKTIRS